MGSPSVANGARTLTTMPQPPTESRDLSLRERTLWLGIRQALVIVLRAIEAYLDMPYSRETRQERKDRERMIG
jgi:hypothetical protein